MQQLSLVLRSFKGAALGPPDAGCQVFITENSACCGSVCSAAGCAPPDVGRAHAAVSTAARPYHCSEMAVLTINPSSSKYLRCYTTPTLTAERGACFGRRTWTRPGWWR